MTLSTPALVLHTTDYSETSVIAKVFTRQLGVRSYILKGVRKGGSRVKRNLLQPLTSLDMVVYNNPRTSLNYVKELAPRCPERESEPIGNALRFFMTEVLYKSLKEEEPMPALWDYVETAEKSHVAPVRDFPIDFLLGVAQYIGIRPLDNYSVREPYFSLMEGRYVSVVSDSTLTLQQSALLHSYLSSADSRETTSQQRRALVNALLSYFQLHLEGFKNFSSHEILHAVLN